MIHDDVRLMPVGDLKPWPKNPRRGNLDMIAESLKMHGQFKPLVVRKATLEVLAGNHTLAAARTLGWPEIAVTLVDVDEDTAARIVLIDNRSNDVAGYNEAELVELLKSIPDLDGTGYDPLDVEALVYGLEQEPPKTPDTIDELPDPVTIAQPGDVYDLGRHRVICGDSTDPATLDKLMGGVWLLGCGPIRPTASSTSARRRTRSGSRTTAATTSTGSSPTPGPPSHPTSRPARRATSRIATRGGSPSSRRWPLPVSAYART